MLKMKTSQFLHQNILEINGNRKSGQTVIEFALVSVLFVFMLVVTYNGILAFGTQQYMSYAAFMAARAYQAAGRDSGEGSGAAAKVLERFIPGITIQGNNSTYPDEGHKVFFSSFSDKRPVAFIKRVLIPTVREGDYASYAGIDRDARAGDIQNPEVSASLPTAVEIDFEVPFASLPLGEDVRVKLGKIKMFAQSYLGRQASRKECEKFFQNFMLRYQIQGINTSGIFTGPEGYYLFMDDNGC